MSMRTRAPLPMLPVARPVASGRPALRAGDGGGSPVGPTRARQIWDGVSARCRTWPVVGRASEITGLSAATLLALGALFVFAVFWQYNWMNAIAIVIGSMYMTYLSECALTANDPVATRDCLRYWVVYNPLCWTTLVVIGANDPIMYVAIKFALILFVISRFGGWVSYELVFGYVVGRHRQRITDFVSHTTDALQRTFGAPRPATAPAPAAVEVPPSPPMVAVSDSPSSFDPNIHAPRHAHPPRLVS